MEITTKISFVPFKVSEQLFWARYLFRIHVAREEETKRQIIRKEAQIRAQADAKASELNWDDGDYLLVYIYQWLNLNLS